MPSLIPCPECRRQLRVSDELLGDLVKCPSCGAEFTAASEPPSPPRGRINPRGEIERDIERDEAFRREEGPLDRPRSTRRERDRDEEDDRVERRPRRRRRDDWDDDEDNPFRYRGSSARSQLNGPATALSVIGILGFALSTLALGLFVMAFAFAGPGGAYRDPGEFIGNLVGAIISMVWGLLLTVGAAGMKKLQNYGLCMTASILAILPCCCGLGIPFGIWGLVVLSRPEVLDSFH
jgi:predicted Zn finger-like uncharacterized protein